MVSLDRNTAVAAAFSARGWLLAAVALSPLLLLATLPPIVEPSLRPWLMQVFSAICHQIPERSPAIDGVQLAACHRCYGVYLGLFAAPFAGLVLRRYAPLLNRSARIAVLASVSPLAIDWLLGAVGLWHNTPVTRMTTGALFGLVAGLLLTLALAAGKVARSRSSLPLA